uniref:MADF domain-containing protein n=1 Tax=Knipowitschia caucasica TaxID=637954 RepID=A0AAV2J664_KNICA
MQKSPVTDNAPYPPHASFEALRVAQRVEECKRRWKGLRDSYVKFKKFPPSGSGGGSERDWRHEKEMAFLKPYLKPRSSRDSHGDTSADDNVQEGADEEASQPQSPNPHDTEERLIRTPPSPPHSSTRTPPSPSRSSTPIADTPHSSQDVTEAKQRPSLRVSVCA